MSTWAEKAREYADPKPRTITQADLIKHEVDVRHGGVRSLLRDLGIEVEYDDE